MVVAGAPGTGDFPRVGELQDGVPESEFHLLGQTGTVNGHGFQKLVKQGLE